MSRVIRLPPLAEEPGMSANEPQNANENVYSIDKLARRPSVLATSDPVADSHPIDCILVYNLSDDHNADTNANIESYMNPAERRKRFEDYLSAKQHLVLVPVESPSKKGIVYVKVHTPFDILLLTAENMRMRLPIEKIEKDMNDALEIDKSCWHRFTQRLKKPFRLDPSLATNDPDYYTAVYSSNILRFKDLFTELRGSKESYFSPSERSLLTHQLLTRAHCYEDEDHLPQTRGAKRPVLNTVVGLREGTKRPGIDRLINKKAYKCYFPLHEPLRDDVRHINDEDLNDREKLQKHWATMRQFVKFQPLSLIRSYMGEKVTFYFALSGFYNQMLIPPALIGLIIFIYGAASVATDEPTSEICGDFGQNTYMCPRCDKICPFWKLADSCVYSKVSYVFDNAATIIFAALMSLWARWFVEFWKRRQAVLRYEWDSMDFEAHLEPIRPAFESTAEKQGGERINPVTEIIEPYIPTKKRVPFFLLATFVVLVTVLIVCATVFATIVYRVQMDYILKNTSVKAYSSIIITVTSAVMNLICTILLSQFYYWLASRITNLENHKYQSKYDDALIIKIYLFQFVNFYSSLFYIAFFKGRFLEYPSKYGEAGTGDFTEQCDPAGCLVELSIQFIIIMIGNQLINNIIEFFTAMRRTCARVCCNRAKHYEEKQWEKDYDLIDFDSMVLIDEYLELVIQFGFVTLFVVAFPLAPLFALLNNIVEIRLDAWKLLSKYKRPIPFKASDIGIWSDILSAVSYLAVLTNAIVIAWTSEFIPKMAFRALQSSSTSLNGYVSWTLSSFPIADYNRTGRMPPNVPSGLTFCRYRDFRESVGPSYSEGALFWNVIAARLAFIIIFEHAIFFIIYLMQWLVSNVPKKIQNKIDHERYIDQRERWASEATKDSFKEAAIATAAMARLLRLSNNDTQSPSQMNNDSLDISESRSPTRQLIRKGRNGIRVSPADQQ